MFTRNEYLAKIAQTEALIPIVSLRTDKERLREQADHWRQLMDRLPDPGAAAKRRPPTA